jgi:hypothetical protein
LDILSLIPTHLSSQNDRFRASFVCHHWRETFLQCGVLWSQLVLRKGEIYAKTLLERAKGSALDVTSSYCDSISTIRLLPPHTQQIWSIAFGRTNRKKIQRFLEINSGPLPLLRTLILDHVKDVNLDDTNPITPHSTPLFSNGVNVEEFTLRCLDGYPFLNRFSFPNLTTFKLLVLAREFTYHALELLDFLESSPMLQTVSAKITAATIGLDAIPEKRVVVLPNAKTFSLTVGGDVAGGYEFVTHISCPSVKHTSLIHERYNNNEIPHIIFPPSHHMDAIARQYAMDPIEEVAFEIDPNYDPFISCSLTFRSPNATALELEFKLFKGDHVEELPLLEDLHWATFRHAFATIQTRQPLTNVKRLLIGWCFISDFHNPDSFTDVFRGLIKSMGPLEVLSISDWDPNIYLGGFNTADEPIAYPPIKELKISHPSGPHHEEQFTSAIVALARSQHSRGTPFERLELRMEELPAGIVERLRPWVGTVDCYEEW